MDEQSKTVPQGDNHAGDMAYFEEIYEKYAYGCFTRELLLPG